jgi:uncharacterized membrane protein
MIEFSAPKKLTFWSGFTLWLVGLLLPFLDINPVPFQDLSTGFILSAFGGLILIIGCAFKSF